MRVLIGLDSDGRAVMAAAAAAAKLRAWAAERQLSHWVITDGEGWVDWSPEGRAFILSVPYPLHGEILL